MALEAPPALAATETLHPAVVPLLDEMVVNRRHFHAYPELSFQVR
jgi:metal-dependent amidase/aminoacylase/carboxypeptidase family protein